MAGNQEEAESLYRQVIAAYESHEDDLEIKCAALLNLGLALRLQARCPEAEPYARRAVIGYEKRKQKKELAMAYANLGLILTDCERYQEAAEMHEKAVNLAKEKHGADSVEAHCEVIDMAPAYIGLGGDKLKEIEQLLLVALPVVEKERGPDHTTTPLVSAHLAHVYEKMEDWVQSEKYYRQAVEGRKRILGEDAVLTLKTTDEFAQMLLKPEDQSKLAQAEQLARRAYEGSERTRGEDNLTTLQYRYHLGLVLRAEQKLEEAERELVRTVVGQNKHLDFNEHFYTANTLGAMCLEQGRYEEAESMFRRGYSVIKTEAHHQLDFIKAAKEGLAAVLRAQGKNEEAEKVLAPWSPPKESETANGAAEAKEGEKPAVPEKS